MPYSVGEKGSHGCSGYPVVKTATGEVMGCHPTVNDANSQLAALHINENKLDKEMSFTPNPGIPGVGIKYPEVNPRRNRKDRKKKRRYNTSAGNGSESGSGTVSSGGSGGSVASKADNIWSGSAFEK